MKQWLRNRRTKRKLHTPLLHTIVVLALLVASFFAMPQSSSADTKSKDITTGNEPKEVAVNPVTNKIYVITYDYYDQSGSGKVTVIDGASNKTMTVAAGEVPGAIAVNPVTNKIYVVDISNNYVTVIDGASNETTTVAVGENPRSIAVNPVTNKIYIVNTGKHNVELNRYVEGSGSITVIDGASNKTTTIAAVVGQGAPNHVAVNPVTNKVYVANGGRVNVDGSDDPEGSVTVIDGASNKATKTVKVGAGPSAFAVNPVTNKIYVANSLSNNVTVMDGASNKVTTTVKVGSTPAAVAVNPVTNKIYVGNDYGNNVTVIDGMSNKTTTVAVGHRHPHIAVNPVTNKIYVTNYGSYNDNLGKVNMTVIDGASNKTTTVPTGKYPVAVAVNPITNKIYVANTRSNSVTVIDDAGRTANPLHVAIAPMSGNNGKSQTFSFHVTNTYSSAAPLVQGVYYQIDSTEGQWKLASRAGKDWSAAVASLTSGEHTIYAWALEAQENGVPAGVVAAYPYSVAVTYKPANVTNDGVNQSFPQSAVLSSEGNTLLPMRVVFEKLGATIEWDQASKTIIATKGSTNIVLTISKATATVNGNSVTLATPAVLISGNTMVPSVS